MHARELWEDSFDATQVDQAWSDVSRGALGARHRRLFHRLAWRATYQEHLRVLNDAIGDEPRATSPVSLRSSRATSDCSSLLLVGGDPSTVAAVLRAVGPLAPLLAVLRRAAVHKHWLQPTSPRLGHVLVGTDVSPVTERAGDGATRAPVDRLLGACRTLGLTSEAVVTLARSSRDGLPPAEVLWANAALLAAIFRDLLKSSGKGALVVPIGRDVTKQAKYAQLWPGAQVVHIRSSPTAQPGAEGVPVPGRLEYPASSAMAKPVVFAAWLCGLAGITPAS